jgi:MinD-like ATPase involved in chromosome partitioning or flagellar assembly
MLPEQRGAANAPSMIAHIPPAVRPERIAIVASGKGGVGTSVCSALLALSCAALGRRTLLIDGNEGNGTLHHLFGVRPLRSIDELRNPTVAVRDVCIDLGDAFTLVSSKPASGDQINLSPDARRAPFERLLPLSAEYDCVIVDGGSRLDAVLAIAASGAGHALLVTDADRIALAATFALLKVLATHAPTVRGSVLVNRHEASVAQRAGTQLTDACARFLGADISLAGSIPDDACLRAAIGAGMPIGDASHDSPAAASMQALALSVFPFLSNARADAQAPMPNHPLRRRS